MEFLRTEWNTARPFWLEDGMPAKTAALIDQFFTLDTLYEDCLIGDPIAVIVNAVQMLLCRARLDSDTHPIHADALQRYLQQHAARARVRSRSSPSSDRSKMTRTDWTPIHRLIIFLLLIDLWKLSPTEAKLPTLVNGFRVDAQAAVAELMIWQQETSHGDSRVKGFKDADQEESKADVNTDLTRIAAATDGDCWVIDGALAGSSIALMNDGVPANRIVAVNRDPITGLLILHRQLFGGGYQTRVLIGEFGDHAVAAPIGSISLLYHDGCTDLPHHDIAAILKAGVLRDDAYLAVTMTKRSRGGFGRVVPTKTHGKTGSTETRLELLTELFPARGLEFDADETINRRDVVVFRGRLIPPAVSAAPASLKRRRQNPESGAGAE